MQVTFQVNFLYHETSGCQDSKGCVITATHLLVPCLLLCPRWLCMPTMCFLSCLYKHISGREGALVWILKPQLQFLLVLQYHNFEEFCGFLNERSELLLISAHVLSLSKYSRIWLLCFSYKVLIFSLLQKTVSKAFNKAYVIQIK